jgi:hypothetical protein
MTCDWPGFPRSSGNYASASLRQFMARCKGVSPFSSITLDGDDIGSAARRVRTTGDALALTFAQPVAPAEVEEEGEEEEFGSYRGSGSSGGWMR